MTQIQESHEFLAVGHRLTHHLRTPLSTARSATQLTPRMLGDEIAVDGLVRAALKALDRVNNSLIAFETLMDAARDARSSTTVRDLVTSMSSTIDSRRGDGYRIRTQVPQDLEERYVPSRLEVALSETVDNALSFDEGGGPIVVDVSADDRGVLRIEVLDRGPGIPDEHRDRVFEAFFSTREDRPGVGLTVASIICHHHEIQFSWENRTPTGCRFEFKTKGVADGTLHDRRG